MLGKTKQRAYDESRLAAYAGAAASSNFAKNSSDAANSTPTVLPPNVRPARAFEATPASSGKENSTNTCSHSTYEQHLTHPELALRTLPTAAGTRDAHTANSAVVRTFPPHIVQHIRVLHVV